MNRIFFAGIVAATLSFGVSADPVPKHDEEFCSALSTYALNIATNRLAGVPKDRAVDALVQQNGGIPSEFRREVAELINTFYREDVVIESGEQLMALVGNLYESCMELEK